MAWQAVIFGPEDTPWEGDNRLYLSYIRCRILMIRLKHVRRDVSVITGVLGGVSEQSPGGEVRLEDLPSQRVRGRKDMFRHLAEPVESHIRHRCYFNIDTITAV
jgi:hypothetical protein